VEPDRTSPLFFFDQELGRQTVSASEFAGALEKVLRGFAAVAQLASPAESAMRVLESDLCRLAHDSGPGRELFFFLRLRDALGQSSHQLFRMLS
jgi:hypothetical protein